VRNTSLFGLAPCGVLPAADVATGAGGPFRPFLPFPAFAFGYSATSPRPAAPKREARRRAVYFLCHCPSGCPDRGLPGALPNGVRTFLPLPSPLPALASRSSVGETTVVWSAATERRDRITQPSVSWLMPYCSSF